MAKDNIFNTREIAEEMSFSATEEIINKGKWYSRNHDIIYRKGTNVELIQELLKKPEDMSPKQQATVLWWIQDNTDDIPQQTSSTENTEYKRPEGEIFTLDEEF